MTDIPADVEEDDDPNQVAPEEKIEKLEVTDEDREFTTYMETLTEKYGAGEEESNTFADCELCGKSIKIGNAFVAVNREVAQIDQDDEIDDTAITVVDSDQLLTLCAGCGKRISTAKLREHLQQLLEG